MGGYGFNDKVLHGDKLMDKLTVKQDLFCFFIASGFPQRESYIRAYNPKSQINTIDSNASALVRNPKVIKKIEELKALKRGNIAKDLQYRKEFLADLAEWNKYEKTNPVWPIQELNKMDKVYTEEPQVKEIRTLVFIFPDGTQLKAGELIEGEAKEIKAGGNYAK